MSDIAEVLVILVVCSQVMWDEHYSTSHYIRISQRIVVIPQSILNQSPSDSIWFYFSLFPIGNKHQCKGWSLNIGKNLFVACELQGHYFDLVIEDYFFLVASPGHRLRHWSKPIFFCCFFQIILREIGIFLKLVKKKKKKRYTLTLNISFSYALGKRVLCNGKSSVLC